MLIFQCCALYLGRVKNKLARIFFWAVAVRLSYLLIVYLINPDGVVVYDSWGYLNLGFNLYHFQEFSQYSDGSFIPDSTRTPVYPLFISLFHLLGLGIWSMLIVQALISSLSVIVIIKITEFVQLGSKTQKVIALLLILDPVSIYFSSVVMSETIFCLLLYLSIYFFIKHRLMFASISLGLTVLCKPIAIYLLILFVVVLLIERKTKLKELLIYAGLCFMIIGSWTYRNQQVFGKTFISSISEVNFLFHTATNIKSKATKRNPKEVEADYRSDLLGDLDWNANSSIPIFMERARAEIKTQVASHPDIFLKLYSRSFVMFFIKPLRSYFDEQFGLSKAESISGVNDSIPGPKQIISNSTWLSLTLSFIQLAILIGIFIGMSMNIGGISFQNRHFWLFVSIILYFAILSSISEVDARFRLPVFPLMIILGLSSVKVQNLIGEHRG